MAPKISVVMNTFNEADRIGRSLASVVNWVDEIVVVDMQSTDDTVEIAKAHGAQVFSHANLGFADPARAYAVENAASEWIMMLDADEVVPSSLAARLTYVALNDEADAVSIPWRNYLLGKWMTSTGWGPEQDRHIRFFKKSRMNFSGNIHGFLEPAPDARMLTLEPGAGMEVFHFNYADTQHWFSKMNRYTSIEAEQRYQRGERYTPTAWNLTLDSGKAFLSRYIRLRGFRDGVHGLLLSLYIAIYTVVWKIKLWEIENDISQAHMLEELERVLNEVVDQ